MVSRWGKKENFLKEIFLPPPNPLHFLKDFLGCFKKRKEKGERQGRKRERLSKGEMLMIILRI